MSAFSGTESGFTMEPVVDRKQLWFVMRDGTGGKTTYAASRFLCADLPKGGVQKSGLVEVDFNRSENPPCVFTDFATCPFVAGAEPTALGGYGRGIDRGRH